MSRIHEENIAALIQGEKWDQAYRACVELKDSGRADSGVLYLGCYALFGMGHIHQAEEWVREYAASGGDEAKRMYLAAFIQLHARRPDQSLLLWTRIVQLDPSQTFADGLIERAREDEDRLLRDAGRPGSLFRFVPLLPEGRAAGTSAFPGRLARVAMVVRGLAWSERTGQTDHRARLKRLVILAAIPILFVSAWFLVRSFGPAARLFDPFYGLEETLPEPPSTGTVISPEKYKDAKYVFKAKEDVVRQYRAAREHIAAGRVNQGRMMLAKIDLSNASFEIKERSRLLRDAVPNVDKKHFNDGLSPAQVIKDADLCAGVQILWRGSVADPRQGQGSLRFILKTDPAAERPVRITCTDCPQLKEGARVDVMGFVKEIQKGALIVDAFDVRKLD